MKALMLVVAVTRRSKTQLVAAVLDTPNLRVG